jgi:hypothetical protein
MTSAAVSPPRPRLSVPTSPVPGRLQQGVDLLPLVVPGCDHASITTVAPRQLRVRVSSDLVGERADELQDELDEGPRLQAVRTGHTVVGHDLHAETRWPGWCSAALAELGLRGVMSVLLLSSLRPLATLSLYSHSVDGLAHVDIAQVHQLAGPLADALLDARLGIDQLGPAA